MTYLDLVNDVLTRLRESRVSTVNQTSYSSLIGTFINDSKRQVEEAWDWDALTTSVLVTVGPSATRYTIPGFGMRQKNIFVNNVSQGFKHPLTLLSYSTLAQREQMSSTTIIGPPMNYSWYGNDGTDSIAAIWPTPNATYTLNFNANVPQVSLVNDTDVLLVPSDCVVMGAYARALVDRGEDGGLASSEAYALFKMTLSDRITVEQSRSDEYDAWEAN